MAIIHEPVDGIEAAKNFAILRREEQEAQTPVKRQQKPNAAGWIAIAVIIVGVLLCVAAVLLVERLPL